MSKYVRSFFNRKEKATATVAGAIEIVVCLQRERCYFHSGHNVTLGQWENGVVVNHPRAVVINEEIQKKVTEFEHILIAMQVNKDDMTIAQFKTYLSADGGNRRNFMAWFRERINNRPHLTEAQLKKLIRMREESKDAVMNKYLDFFLFQTFTGMAYSDAKSFDYEQHVVSIGGKDYIDGHRIKTGNEFVTPILPITRKILERNNFNMEITSNQKYNQFLKGIGLALGCSFPLTTHIARHTFGTMSLSAGISIESIAKMMGHASIASTQIYAQVTDNKISEDMDRLIRKYQKEKVKEEAI